jgi:hypothetical protein
VPPDSGETPLRSALVKPNSPHFDLVVRVLLGNGANPNVATNRTSKRGRSCAIAGPGVKRRFTGPRRSANVLKDQIETGVPRLERLASQVMRANGTGVDLNGDYVTPSPGNHLQLRDEPGGYRVAGQIRQAFLEIERLVHPAHVTGSVLDTDEQGTARYVGEGHETPEHAVRRREVALEARVATSSRAG